MALEYWAKKQLEKDNIDGVERARELIEQYGDVPLELTATLLSKEQREETLRFSQEARKGLEKEGYLIYELRKQSIKSFKEQGRRFDSTWHRDFPQFEALTSRECEVAINPNQLFLPDSNRKTYEEQEGMVKIFYTELSRRIPEIEVIIGECPDYIELAFNHLDKTSERLFGEKYNYYYTRTKTLTEASPSFVAGVGRFDAGLGLDVKRWHRDNGITNNLWVAVIVVPARTPSEKYSGTRA